jgi:LPXTG-site transpeptidase (sortase) family protein
MIKGLLVKSMILLTFANNMNYKTTIIESQFYYENPVIEIEKINLKQEFYPNDKEKNNVDKNIQVIETSQMPEQINSNLILASHSGNSSIAYFKHLDKLKINDSVYIYYKNKKYKYIIYDNYEVEKTGYLEIKRKQDKTTLTLITCKKGTNKQLVFIGYLEITQTL